MARKWRIEYPGALYHPMSRGNSGQEIQWFGTTYTRKFNLGHHANGHLFQGRFKSIVVENDAYLLRLSCDIHRNPVRAGIVDRLADYKWSSYPFYAYKKKPPGWLKIKLILNQLSGVIVIRPIERRSGNQMKTSVSWMI